MFIRTNFMAIGLTALLTSATSFAAPTQTQSSESDQLTKARQMLEQKEYPQAVHQLKALILKDSENADAYNLLGFANRKLQQYDVAEYYYSRALKLDPEHRGAMSYLGILYVETGRFQEASAMLKQLDEACFFECDEYRALKAHLDSTAGKEPVVAEW